MRPFSIFALFVLCGTVTACENRKAEAASVSTSAAMVASSALMAASPATNAPSTKVVRIVFVGKEHACDCTRKKVETALTALQKVLGTPPRITVEMLKVDTEEAKVEPYRKMHPMLAIPAIYFIDGKNGLVDMLEGEITEAQVSKVLGAPTAASNGA